LILQQNLPLYNLFIYTISFAITVYSLTFLFKGQISTVFFFLILSIICGVLVFFRRKRQVLASNCQSEFEIRQEKINLLTESIEEKRKLLESLPTITQRISFLFNVSKNLIELAEPDEILDFLLHTLGEVLPQAESILIFGFDKEKDLLSLVRTIKRTSSTIKEKHGDELDKWVLRKNQSLLIDDITNDFRFNYSKVSAYRDRGVCSFMVSPISVGNRLLGVVRIESKQPLSFSMEDSRILRNVCDLGAVVLERANLIKGAQDLAIKDSLTSFFVKDYFFERLNDEIKRARAKGSKIGLLMIDIDDFRKINNAHGHIVGDFTLKKLAKIIKSKADGPGNTISRFGGEEFIISLVESDKDDLSRIAESIRKEVETMGLSFRRKKVNFTVSLGAALYPDDGENTLELVDKVDKLMYKAKQKGKNQVCFS